MSRFRSIRLRGGSGWFLLRIPAKLLAAGASKGKLGLGQVFGLFRYYYLSLYGLQPQLEEQMQDVIIKPGVVLFQEPEVFITLCSTAGQARYKNHVVNLDRRLEVNWNNFKDFKEGDFIALFDFDVEKERPEGADLLELAKESAVVKGPRGSHTTSVRLERRTLSASQQNNNEEPCVYCESDFCGCLGYWVAYLRYEDGLWTVLKSNSFKVRPNWMWDLRDEIADIPLHSLMIPGAHDAGAWMEYDPKTCENIYVRYYACQEDPIYDQLVHGIRYLDVRVAYYPDSVEKFWVNHDKYRCHPLITLLTDVSRFAEETNEIVFLDFHNFPIGFSGPNYLSVHQELIGFVMGEIGKYMMPKPKGLNAPSSRITPKMLWTAGKSIIWTYAEDSCVVENKYLWPYLIHAWGNKRKPHHLEQYMEDAMRRYNGKRLFWSAMAELTPRPFDYISKPRYGLRGFAEWVNIPLTLWFQREKWYSRCMIVSTDFYLGNNIIETAIKVNKHKVLANEHS